MLKVTADIFSGRENPSWILDENQAKDIIKQIANNRGVVADSNSGFQGLGFRGMSLEFLSDEIHSQYNLPANFTIANGASMLESKGLEIAEQLISTMSSGMRVNSFMQPVPDMEGENLQQLLLEQLDSLPRAERMTVTIGAEGMTSQMDQPMVSCAYEWSAFNPGFWNNDPTVQANNNCYNYATNRRTNTFAQPGRATGFFPYPMDCPSVMRGALSDGAHKFGDCLPDSENPRWLMALVVWPGVDYHWYRYHSNRFWGHKPGRTAARNTDNSGHVITNPQTADRGGYTLFCGYMYAARSMRIR
ncbi:MAG: hypothetical protein VKL59_15055 [Nostocaceae cyanobacterium]|nr:hypothetical protein [Nostocaceae cyanobacterium]